MNVGVPAHKVVYLKDRRRKPARATSPNYRDLESYCDSPDRSGEVPVILRVDNRRGFAMLITDGCKSIKVVGDGNKPHRFRTVEIAIDELIDVPCVAERIVIERGR
jgi:hypothetical protein